MSKKEVPCTLSTVLGSLLTEIVGDDGGGLRFGLRSGGEIVEMCDASMSVVETGDLFPGGFELRGEPSFHFRDPSGVGSSLGFAQRRRITGHVAHRFGSNEEESYWNRSRKRSGLEMRSRSLKP